MNNETLLANLRVIPDWPIKGVNFRDVTTLFKNGDCVKIITDEMTDLYGSDYIRDPKQLQ